MSTDWYDWTRRQEIPGLWGKLPEDPAEYQAAMYQAAVAKIALEPNTESPGPCSDMWCNGMIKTMIQNCNVSAKSTASDVEVGVSVLNFIYLFEKKKY
jgi:hypothetical protein